MTRYRIYTEHKNYDEIVKLVSQHLDGATLYPLNKGIWRGIVEDSLVIEHLGDGTEKTVKTVYRLAKDIKKYNNQESVLVTRELVDVEFI